MTSPSFLQIKDRRFEVKDSLVCAFLDEDGRLTWMIDVTSQPKTFDDESWSPRAYLEGVPWDIGNAREMSTTPIVIPDGETFGDGTILPDSMLCCLYVFSHNFLRDSVTHVQKSSANSFTVSWTAKCDVFFDDDYDFDLPLEIEAQARFLGITTQVRDEAKARSLLSRSFDESQLSFDPTPEFDTSQFMFRE